MPTLAEGSEEELLSSEYTEDVNASWEPSEQDGSEQQAGPGATREVRAAPFCRNGSAQAEEACLARVLVP